MSDGRQLNIVSIETLISLYLSLTFRKQLEKYMEFPILCLVQELIEISMLYRKNYKDSSSKPFPFISVECSGHQKQMPTLLKEKVERIRAAKNAVVTPVKGSLKKMSLKVPHNAQRQKDKQKQRQRQRQTRRV